MPLDRRVDRNVFLLDAEDRTAEYGGMILQRRCYPKKNSYTMTTILLILETEFTLEKEDAQLSK